MRWTAAIALLATIIAGTPSAAHHPEAGARAPQTIDNSCADRCRNARVISTCMAKCK